MSVDSDTSSSRSQSVRVVRDDQRCLPLSEQLVEGDLVVLLTPLIPPSHPDPEGRTSDPFEPLGQALARMHKGIRHVPYTPRGGITSTHVAFLNLAKVVVFVVSGPAGAGQYSQIQLSELVRRDKEDRPHVVVACCDIKELGPLERTVPTIVEIAGFSPSHLEMCAETLFQTTFSRTASAAPAEIKLPSSFRPKVEEWDWKRDNGAQDAMLELWNDRIGGKFHMDQATFRKLLNKDGYHKHFLVRDPKGSVIAFCTTYTHYLAKDEVVLVGSLGVIIVQEGLERQGIGKMLHEHALKSFGGTRGVEKIRLGTTFPRFLYGMPVNSPAERWFSERGWRLDQSRPGTGQVASDWIISIKNWKPKVPIPQVRFRPCGEVDFTLVPDFVDRISLKNHRDIWFDAYTKLSDGNAYKNDVVVAVAGDMIVATALLYTPPAGIVADELPWAPAAAHDIDEQSCGGLTCVCIDGKSSPNLRADDNRLRKYASETTFASKDDLMAGIIDFAARAFQPTKDALFLDAIVDGDRLFGDLGSYLQVPSCHKPPL
jgi:ribosomal protein S18 acetylase RimI-like enzyme